MMAFATIRSISATLQRRREVQVSHSMRAALLASLMPATAQTPLVMLPLLAAAAG
jgi:hypothetical protein